MLRPIPLWLRRRSKAIGFWPSFFSGPKSCMKGSTWSGSERTGCGILDNERQGAQGLAAGNHARFAQTGAAEELSHLHARRFGRGQRCNASFIVQGRVVKQPELYRHDPRYPLCHHGGAEAARRPLRRPAQRRGPPQRAPEREGPADILRPSTVVGDVPFGETPDALADGSERAVADCLL